jgi:tetratricopeptide (TPR) repeat protein
MANSDSSTPDSTVSYGNSKSKLPLPPLNETFRPGYFFRLVEYWFVSRVPLRVLLGLPSAIVVIAGVLFLLHLNNNDQTAVVRGYQQAVVDAVETGENWDAALLYLKSLCSLQPNVPSHKYRLALLYHQLGNDSVALGLMQQLAPLKDVGGFALAHMWIAKQTALGKLSELSQEEKDEFVQRLQIASGRTSDRQMKAEANALLADYYISEGQPVLAETYLSSAAAVAPELYLSLAVLQKKLGRDSDLISSGLESAKIAFERRRREAPEDVTSLIKLAESLALANQFREAAIVLREGLSRQDTPELRAALSQLHVDLAAKKLYESPLNRVVATDLLVQSLKITPQNVAVIARLASFPEAKSTVSEKHLDTPLTYWRQQVSDGNQPTASIALARLLTTCGRTAAAIEQLESVAAEYPMLRPMLAQLYVEANRTEEGDRLFDQLLKELDERSDQPAMQTVYARSVLLFHARRFDEAATYIRAHREDVPDSKRAPFDQIYVRVLAAMADRLLNAQDDASAAALNLLQESLSVVPHDHEAVIRIARISCSELAAADEADALLIKILAEGSFNAGVYRLVGTEALLRNQFEKASRNLETANRLEPNNAMVLNNLALANLRGPDPNYDYALTLVKSALDLTPDHPDALGTSAEIYLAMERWEEADRDLQRALPKRQSNENLRQMLVMVNEKLGNQQLADEHRDILAKLQAQNR